MRTKVCLALLVLAAGVLASAFVFRTGPRDTAGATGSTAAPPPVLDVPAAVELGRWPGAEPRQVRLQIGNTSGQPVQVVGVLETCTPGGCVKTSTELPAVVPPGGHLELALLCTRWEPGPYSCNFEIYTDIPGCLVTTVRLTGTVE
ncbi:hypothetical protein R5W23_002865 [Gemmata sp. JC673]|uniref:DUF1573 domain-containing protein n=1 Tax=Gemmata algarum TaxID=2975278 RepID=A0ABU5F496_9BACT|nr:hypothetical protein [Gemmata algarum]MDY3561587.1 hypothetical protein [Gemmata algarum]